MDTMYTYRAGIAQPSRMPFNSMEINDQKNGVNGIIDDDISTQAGTKIAAFRTKKIAGVVRTPFENTQSTAYAH